MNGKQLLCL